MEYYSSLLSRECSGIYKNLSDEQKTELASIIKSAIEYPVPRNLFFAGAFSLKELNEEMGGELLYGGIRGSVARANSDKDDDVDLLVATRYPDDAKDILKEISLKYGKKLKEMLPYLERGEKNLITYIVLDENKYELFLNDPISLDLDEIDIQQKNRLGKASKIIMDAHKIISESGIMDDPEKNPFKFIDEKLKPLAFSYLPSEVRNNWKKISEEKRARKLKYVNKLISHCLIYTVGRMVGIQLYGNEIEGRHKVVEARDNFLKKLVNGEVVLDRGSLEGFQLIDGS